MGNEEAKPHWDVEGEHCLTCKAELRLLGKHHCRNCGKVFCHRCSAFKSLVPQHYRDNIEKRVCKPCHQTLCSPEGQRLAYQPIKTLDSNGTFTAHHESSDHVTIDNFQLQAIIGTGKYGKVAKVKKLDTGEIFAMKVLDKKRIKEWGEVKHTLTERRVLMKVDHPFLMKLRYAFKSADQLYLVMDFMNGGELFYHLQQQSERRFSEDRARFYAAEIVLGLEHLHEKGIIYRDLKPENVLLDREGHIRLTDFGLSKELMESNDRTKTFCGTAEYLAPEIIASD